MKRSFFLEQNEVIFHPLTGEDFFVEVAKDFIFCSKDSKEAEILEGQKRLLTIQLNFPDEAWREIELEQGRLSLKEDFEGILLNIPSEQLFEKEPRSFLTIKKNLRISNYGNMFAWVTFCHWLNEEIQEQLRTIFLDALDEYRIEAIFKDFEHEINSSFLQEAKKAHLKFSKELFSTEDASQILELEEKLFEVRSEMKNSCREFSRLLGVIQEEIEVIESFRKELTTIKEKAFLLKILLDSSLDGKDARPLKPVQKWLLTALLAKKFHATLRLTSKEGKGTLFLCLAACIVARALEAKYPFKRVVEGFSHLGDKIDPLEEELKKWVLETLENLFPLKEKKYDFTLKETLGYLALLPEYKEDKKIKILKTDPITKEVLGLTEAGMALWSALVE